jgi:hypothetical protein
MGRLIPLYYCYLYHFLCVGFCRLCWDLFLVAGYHAFSHFCGATLHSGHVPGDGLLRGLSAHGLITEPLDAEHETIPQENL